MAVLQMQRISICALKKDRKKILDTLQRCGVVEISDLSAQDPGFEKVDTSASKSQFEKAITAANQALEVLDTYNPVKSSMLSSLEGRKPVSAADYQSFESKYEQVLNQAQTLTALSRKIAENKAEILKLQAQLDSLEPWMGLGVSMRFDGTRSTAGFVGSFSDDLPLEAIYAGLAENAPNTGAVNVDIISHSADQTCVLILCARPDGPAVEAALRTMGFVRPASPSKLSPAEHKKEIEAALEAALTIIDAAEENIREFFGARDDLRFLIDYCNIRIEKYDAVGRSMQSKSTFFLTGYIPQVEAAALVPKLENSYDICVSISDPGEDEDVPVLLKNNGFAKPVESVVESYALPTKGEIDPTMIVACFYYLMFGLMFSDTGYGAMVTLGCGFVLWKFKNMEDGMRNMMKMFLYCGISTMFWGIMFSSYFGDVVDVIGRVFFGVDITIPPLWFIPLNEPMRLLVFCMGLGVIHLFIGLGIQLYQHLKAKRYYEAVTKVVFWYMLVGGGILLLLSTDMIANILQVQKLPATVGTVSTWVTIIGAVGITLTNGDSKNPVVKFIQGLYELYGVTSYLSDVLSYSRLLALGLATGVVGTVINQMGSMMGGSLVGGIVFILVFCFGHLLNFGIELLGAYVHTNRLQYVEFFGKFYEGGGRKFDPFAVHTKYYKIKEDTHNV